LAALRRFFQTLTEVSLVVLQAHGLTTSSTPTSLLALHDGG
jgi:hypothetical protein